MTQRLRDAAAALVLALLNVALYRKVVWLWWTYDDPFNLHAVLTHRLIDPFVNRAIWPQQLFTPLMMTAFSAEAATVGLDARWWYAINLGLAALSTICIYAAVRLFFDWLPSFVAAALFAASVPMCSVVVQLSTVHYFIAIIFGALSVIAYVIAVRRGARTSRPQSAAVSAGDQSATGRDARPLRAGGPRSLAIVSALAYLAAMLAKEVAVPLPLFLTFVPRRSRYVIAHWLMLPVYFVWRRLVIGTFFGAYSWVIAPGEWPKLLLMLPWRVIQAMAGANLFIGLALIALMLIGIVLAAKQSREALLITIVAMIVVLGPILPLAKEVNRRYVLVPWIAVSIAFAAGARRNKALLAIAPLLLIVANRQEWTTEFATRLRMSNEARFMVDMPVNGLLERPTTPPATMRELNWVKMEQLHRPAGASWFYDDFYLCSHDIAGKRLYTYNPGTRWFVELTPRVPQITQRHCGSIRNDKPLRVRFEFHDPAFAWDLGPYANGTYTAVLADGYEAFKIPAKDALNIPGVTALPIRIRYDSPDGWTTYSPGFNLDLVHQPNFEWHR